MNITDNISQDTIYKQGTAGVTYGRPQQNFSVPAYPSLAPLNKAPAQPKSTFLPPIPSRRAYNVNETPEPEQPTTAPDVSGAHQVIDHAFDNAPTNGGAMSAPSQEKDRERIKQDVNKIASADNPDEAAKSLLNKPFYKDKAFYSGLLNTGLAIMSGANPLEAAQAGMQAVGEEKGAQDVEANKRQLANQKDQLLQKYDEASVMAAIQAGDPSLLKQKTMTEQERHDLAVSDRNEERSYQEALHARDRGEKLSDEQQRLLQAKENKAPQSQWRMGPGGVMYNTVTGEKKEGGAGGATAKGGKFPEPEGVDEETTQQASQQGYYKDQSGNYHQWDNKKGQYVLVNPKQAEALAKNEPEAIKANVDASQDSLNNLLQYQPMERNPKTGKWEVKTVSEGVKATSGTVNANTPTLFADTKDAQAQKQQIASEMITHARDLLKGQGAVSDADLKMLGESQTILGKEGLSVEAQKRELERIANILQRAQDREKARLNKRQGALSQGASTTTGNNNITGDNFDINSN